MASIDITTRLSGTVAVVTTAIGANGTTNGVIIDTWEYESLNFDFLSGSSIGADLAVTMEHDDDPGFATAEAVPADFIVGTLPSYLIANAETETVKSVGYVGKKRYVRVNVVTTNYATTTFISSIANLGNARVDPV